MNLRWILVILFFAWIMYFNALRVSGDGWTDNPKAWLPTNWDFRRMMPTLVPLAVMVAWIAWVIKSEE